MCVSVKDSPSLSCLTIASVCVYVLSLVVLLLLLLIAVIFFYFSVQLDLLFSVLLYVCLFFDLSTIRLLIFSFVYNRSYLVLFEFFLFLCKLGSFWFNSTLAVYIALFFSLFLRPVTWIYNWIWCFIIIVYVVALIWID